jgi:CMP-N-acetylneuraminic acid synthetase
MINNKSILAIITARGGSKGVPGKNIKNLGGKPLIAWTIEAAKKSKYIDRLITTSDSNEIIKISEEYGSEAPFVRPSYLANDLSRQEDAISHAMEWVENNDKKYNYVLLLQPTSPFRDLDEINAVVEYFELNPKARSVLVVKEAEKNPLMMNMLPEDHSMKDFIPKELRLKNRQELPTYYQINGSTCIAEWDHFMKEGSFLTSETYAYITDDIKGFDIDTVADYMLAEIYLEQLMKKN